VKKKKDTDLLPSINEMCILKRLEDETFRLYQQKLDEEDLLLSALRVYNDSLRIRKVCTSGFWGF
jgi:hypothetical protein